MGGCSDIKMTQFERMGGGRKAEGGVTNVVASRLLPDQHRSIFVTFKSRNWKRYSVNLLPKSGMLGTPPAYTVCVDVQWGYRGWVIRWRKQWLRLVCARTYGSVFAYVSAQTCDSQEDPGWCWFTALLISDKGQTLLLPTFLHPPSAKQHRQVFKSDGNSLITEWLHVYIFYKPTKDLLLFYTRKTWKMIRF